MSAAGAAAPSKTSDTKSSPAAPAKSESQIIDELKAVLQTENIQPHLTLLTLSGGVLTLAGRVPIALGSLLNLILWDFQKLYPGAFKAISRAGITWVPRHQSKGTYELSPDDADLTEYSDDQTMLERKLQFTAERIKAAKHLVVYTGAGISTAAKIPDFRGPQGVWTRRDRGQAAPECIAMEQAVPTLAHRALVRLRNVGIMKYLVSQNVDGLHRRSGIPREGMSELHGNCYIENCSNPVCGAEFLRTYDVCANRGRLFIGTKDEASKSGISHITGRLCDTCKKGMLRDSIIHFGEDLPEQALQLAFEHSKKADVALIVGTSLRVTPAADLPQNVKRNGGPMICVNLQATGKDQHILASGGILIHAKCDQVMSLLMSKLGVDFTDTTQTELEAEVVRFKELTAKADAEKKAKEQERKKKEEMWAAKAKADGIDLKASASASASASAAAGSAPAKAGAAAAASAGGDAKSAAYPTKFWVGNTNEANPDKKDTNKHRWTLFVSADDTKITSCAHFVSKVDLKLHPTFDPSHFTLKPSDPNGLTLTRYGWGTFIIPLTIHFTDPAREPVTVSHTLVLDPAQPFVGTSVAVPPPKGAGGAGLFGELLGTKPKLKPAETKVTTINGTSYIEKPAPK